MLWDSVCLHHETCPKLYIVVYFICDDKLKHYGYCPKIKETTLNTFTTVDAILVVVITFFI